MAQVKLRRMKPRASSHKKTSLSKSSLKKFSFKKYNIFRKGWQIATASGLIILFALTISVFMYNAKMATNRIIGSHIEELSQLFNLINETCGILNFEHDVNYVDFLNVGSFVGSEVGAMNLRKPQEWGGPYVQDNPTVQTKYYEIIKTNKGFFLVPGKDVKLSNGSVIGTDIIFDKETAISELIENGTLVNIEGKPLAAQIPTVR